MQKSGAWEARVWRIPEQDASLWFARTAVRAVWPIQNEHRKEPLFPSLGPSHWLPASFNDARVFRSRMGVRWLGCSFMESMVAWTGNPGKQVPIGPQFVQTPGAFINRLGEFWSRRYSLPWRWRRHSCQHFCSPSLLAKPANSCLINFRCVLERRFVHFRDLQWATYPVTLGVMGLSGRRPRRS